MEQKLREKVAEIIRYADTSENPVLIPESLERDYLKAATRILDLIKEAGYVRLAEGDKVICKVAWDLLSPTIKAGLEKENTGWRRVMLPKEEKDGS